MKVSYKKLWKLLIDKDMKKADLRRKTGVSSATIAKLTRGDDVKTSVLHVFARCLLVTSAT